MQTVSFDAEKTEGLEAVVVSFDLTGFSDFCSRPDAHVIIPRFLSCLFNELNGFLMDWFDELLAKGRSEDGKLARPQFIKFTGDGALMIWLADATGEFTEDFCTDLVAAMRNLQNQIATVIPAWEKKWRTHSLPRKARFGIATGLVYGLRNSEGNLRPKGDPDDYVGYSINLAVRLQDHCREVGFLVQQTVHPNVQGMEKLLAIGMKGTREEPVLAYSRDLEGLPEGYFKTKFRRQA